jgi:hypothetical protein
MAVFVERLASTTKQTVPELRFVQIAANHYELAVARLARPRFSEAGVEEHMHAVKMQASRLAIQTEHTFHA